MKFIACGILCVIFLLSISNTEARSHRDVVFDDSDLIVETTSGFVKGGYGGRTPVGRNPVYWYRSIPFAEPPVGNLRFEPPVPVKRWEGVKDVSEKESECLQGDADSILGSEDCLYIKIYTTELPREQKKLPVMVWIYGGAFIFGHPNFTDHSPDLLLDQGVMVVALHYRIGIFGFLSTGDSVVPGNNALKDQVLALRWIKDNIERFGGDPDHITLFGQSAGGASIGYLLQTPQSKGLFNRAILQSGTPLCLWSLSRQGLNLARNVARDLNVDSANTQNLVNGLRSVDAVELQIAQMDVMMRTFLTVNMREGLLFAPVIEPEHEGAIITGRTHQLLEQGNFHDVPIIIGYNSLEALLPEIPDMLRILLLTYDLQPSRLVPIDMNIRSLITRSMVGQQIKSHYFGNRMISQSNIEVLEFISDDQFARPIQEAAILYSRKNPVYLYRFSHEGPLFGVGQRNFPGFMENGILLVGSIYGTLMSFNKVETDLCLMMANEKFSSHSPRYCRSVGHTEELGYIFDFGHAGSDEDYLTRSRVVKLWTNFAKTGNPTPEVDPLLQGIRWESLVESRLNFLEINKDLELSENPDSRSLSFWNDLYDRNGVPPYGTY